MNDDYTELLARIIDLEIVVEALQNRIILPIDKDEDEL
jgi:hypothetical protein